MKTRLLPLLLCLIGSVASAEPLKFSGEGFKIDPLEQPAGPAATHVAVALTMPASDGFSPNVNVMVQAYAEGLDAFVALSKQQFKEMGAKLIVDKKVSAQEWVVEYTGKLPQGDLHFYARALPAEGKVYLVTGTDKASNWTKHAAALKKCVDSFAIAK